jgi:hypothetical protein
LTSILAQILSAFPRRLPLLPGGLAVGRFGPDRRLSRSLPTGSNLLASLTDIGPILGRCSERQGQQPVEQQANNSSIQFHTLCSSLRNFFRGASYSSASGMPPSNQGTNL